ncbi:hypothetical protein CHS0354_026965 [Potamilus streckersoni]|uniref:F-box/LRR-repeat protein 8 n=1 Tax=Potamilus streckersoni TaxID=2493646 RepID=A0AAE0SC35_9BIVA|nr:hypothetical protein CHS0354_026965 [Potamilus streckersoni]
MALESHSWDNIPEHVLAKVLSHLSFQEKYYSSLTCKHWYNVFQSPQLWHCFQFWFNMPQHHRFLNCVDIFGKYFRKVFIGLNQAIKENRINACTFLEKLAKVDPRRLCSITIEFTGENPLFYAGQEFVQCLKILFGPVSITFTPPSQILHVDVSGLSAALDDDVFDILSENNPDLRFLNIQNKNLVCKVSPACILRLVRRCRKLTDIHVLHCSMSDEILACLAEEDSKDIKHLSILCRREDKYGKDLSAEAWEQLVYKKPSLRVTLAFDHNCPLNLVSVIMKPEIPVRTLKLETFTKIYDEVNLATSYYKRTLEKIVLQTRNSVELEEALVDMARKCTRIKCMMVYCILKEEVVNHILNLLPEMRETGSYILKWEIDIEPWVVVGIESGD